MTVRHHITTGTIVGLSLAVSGSPALARPVDLTRNGSHVPAGSPAMRRPPTAPARRPIVMHVSAGSGFDWGDAGIGAAGGFALSLIAVGGALAASERRSRRTQHNTTITG